MLIIDRFEDEFAIIENGNSYLRIEKNKLPADAKENDVLIFYNGNYTVDTEMTTKRRNELIKLHDSLWE